MDHLNGTTLNGTTVSLPSFELWVLPVGIAGDRGGMRARLFWEMSHKLGYMSRQRFFSSAPHVVQLILLLLDLAGIVVSAISPGTLTFFNPIVRRSFSSPWAAARRGLHLPPRPARSRQLGGDARSSSSSTLFSA